MKILSDETNIGTATTVSSATAVRLYNSDSSAGIVTRTDGSNSTIGNFTVPAGEVLYLQKKSTDKLIAPSTVFASKVAYTSMMHHASYVSGPSYSMSQSATAVDEGGNVVYTVTTTNVDDGTTLYYSLSGTATAADFNPASLTGSFTISSDTGTFTITIATDAVTDPAETFTASVRTDSTSGEIVATSSQVTITDVVPESYYAASFGGNSSEFMSGLAIDGSGNLYSSGYTGSFGNGIYALLLVKFNEDGVVQWGRSFSSTGVEYTESTGETVATDSSGNVYISGYISGGNAIFAKYNSSGVLQWQQKVSKSGGTTSGGVAVDNSDNVYAFGTNYILKSNSSATQQWQRVTASTTNWRAAAFDSSDNLYITGNYGNDLVVTKYNSSGTEQFTRKLSLSSRYLIGRGIGLDSSGNIYVSGSFRPTSGGNSNNGIVIAKYNSSGTIVWQRKLDSASNEDFGDALAIDSSDNIYISGSANATGSYTEGFVAKYNSSGTIQWQRTFGMSGSPSGRYMNGSGMVIDSADNIYPHYYTTFAGPSSGSYNGLFFKLPNDGSLTGTYSIGATHARSIIYSASSLPESAGGFTDSSATIQTGTSGYTWSSISLTSATETITSAVTDIE